MCARGLVAAIALKGVGRTATAPRRAVTILSLDLSSQRDVLRVDLDQVCLTPRPVLIDERQL